MTEYLELTEAHKAFIRKAIVDKQIGEVLSMRNAFMNGYVNARRGKKPFRDMYTRKGMRGSEKEKEDLMKIADNLIKKRDKWLVKIYRGK